MAAFALAEAGVKSVTVLERGAPVDGIGGYSVAMGPRGIRMLQNLPGVWERISARASKPRAEPFVHFQFGRNGGAVDL